MTWRSPRWQKTSERGRQMEEFTVIHFYKTQSPKWTHLGLISANRKLSLCYIQFKIRFPHFLNHHILFFNLLYLHSLKTDQIVRFCCTSFFFLALGGQSETPASISVPATPQRHAALVRGRFQRHSEVPEERGLDKLTASWNLGESVKGVDFTVYAPIRVFALPCLKTVRVPETVTVRPTSRSGLCDDRRHTPTVDRSPSPALKSRHDVNTDGFNIPVVQSGAQEWIDTAARAAVTDVGRSPPGQNRHV